MKTVLKELANEIMTEKETFFHKNLNYLCIAQKDDLSDAEGFYIESENKLLDKLISICNRKEIKVEDFREDSGMFHSWAIGNESEVALFVYYAR